MANVFDSKHWQDYANMVLAIILFVTPWVLGYADQPSPAWNTWVSAVVIAGLAIAAVMAFAEWEEWLELVLGLWVAVSPWILGFAGNVTATWAHVAIGILVAVIAAWELYQVRQQPRAAV